jgi:hypothetical protein
MEGFVILLRICLDAIDYNRIAALPVAKKKLPFEEDMSNGNLTHCEGESCQSGSEREERPDGQAR